jgi:hypothetical protein
VRFVFLVRYVFFTSALNLGHLACSSGVEGIKCVSFLNLLVLKIYFLKLHTAPSSPIIGERVLCLSNRSVPLAQGRSPEP